MSKGTDTKRVTPSELHIATFYDLLYHNDRKFGKTDRRFEFDSLAQTGADGWSVLVAHLIGGKNKSSNMSKNIV